MPNAATSVFKIGVATVIIRSSSTVTKYLYNTCSVLYDPTEIRWCRAKVSSLVALNKAVLRSDVPLQSRLVAFSPASGVSPEMPILLDRSGG